MNLRMNFQMNLRPLLLSKVCPLDDLNRSVDLFADSQPLDTVFWTMLPLLGCIFIGIDRGAFAVFIAPHALAKWPMLISLYN